VHEIELQITVESVEVMKIYSFQFVCYTCCCFRSLVFVCLLRIFSHIISFYAY